MKSARSRFASAFALVLTAASPLAASAQDFYAGKQIIFIIGTAPGGGFDIYGRTVARHLPKHIPGNPVIVVQNMNGASSMRAAAHIFNVAPKDGTVVGAISPGAVVGRCSKASPTRSTIRRNSTTSPPPTIPRAYARRSARRRRRRSRTP